MNVCLKLSLCIILQNKSDINFRIFPSITSYKLRKTVSKNDENYFRVSYC